MAVTYYLNALQQPAGHFFDLFSNQIDKSCQQMFNIPRQKFPEVLEQAVGTSFLHRSNFLICRMIGYNIIKKVGTA